MFESWVSELLASYLGHFVDIQKEQLRVSLWSGGSCICNVMFSAGGAIVITAVCMGTPPHAVTLP